MGDNDVEFDDDEATITDVKLANEDVEVLADCMPSVDADSAAPLPSTPTVALTERQNEVAPPAEDSPLSPEDKEAQLNGRLHLGMEPEGILPRGCDEIAQFTVKWGLRVGFARKKAAALWDSFVKYNNLRADLWHSAWHLDFLRKDLASKEQQALVARLAAKSPFEHATCEADVRQCRSQLAAIVSHINPVWQDLRERVAQNRNRQREAWDVLLKVASLPTRADYLSRMQEADSLPNEHAQATPQAQSAKSSACPPKHAAGVKPPPPSARGPHLPRLRAPSRSLPPGPRSQSRTVLNTALRRGRRSVPLGGAPPLPHPALRLPGTSHPDTSQPSRWRPRPLLSCEGRPCKARNVPVLAPHPSCWDHRRQPKTSCGDHLRLPNALLRARSRLHHRQVVT
eukprot:767296-Amphidinium_carterae.2